MAGEGLDDAFLRSNRLATTTNDRREVGFVAGIVWILGFFLLHRYAETSAAFWGGGMLVFLAGLGTAWWVHRFVTGRQAARRARAAADYRETLERETERQLAEMRAREEQRNG